MIMYELEGRRLIAAERIERLADDYRRANSRRDAQEYERYSTGRARQARSVQWRELEA